MNTEFWQNISRYLAVLVLGTWAYVYDSNTTEANNKINDIYHELRAIKVVMTTELNSLKESDQRQNLTLAEVCEILRTYAELEEWKHRGCTEYKK